MCVSESSEVKKKSYYSSPISLTVFSKIDAYESEISYWGRHGRMEVRKYKGGTS